MYQSQPASTPSLFGGQATSGSSLFGPRPAGPNPNPGGLFGTQQPTPSLFGSPPQQAPTPGIFGGGNATGLFGNAQNAQKSLFGPSVAQPNAMPQGSSNLFGQPQAYQQPAQLLQQPIASNQPDYSDPHGIKSFLTMNTDALKFDTKNVGVRGTTPYDDNDFLNNPISSMGKGWQYTILTKTKRNLEPISEFSKKNNGLNYYQKQRWRRRNYVQQ